VKDARFWGEWIIFFGIININTKSKRKNKGGINLETIHLDKKKITNKKRV